MLIIILAVIEVIILTELMSIRFGYGISVIAKVAQADHQTNYQKDHLILFTNLILR